MPIPSLPAHLEHGGREVEHCESLTQRSDDSLSFTEPSGQKQPRMQPFPKEHGAFPNMLSQVGGQVFAQVFKIRLPGQSEKIK